MPALVALRFNPDLKAKYQSMMQAIKSLKFAITKLMKLAIILIKENPNLVKKMGLIKTDTSFDEQAWDKSLIYRRSNTLSRSEKTCLFRFNRRMRSVFRL